MSAPKTRKKTGLTVKRFGKAVGLCFLLYSIYCVVSLIFPVVEPNAVEKDLDFYQDFFGLKKGFAEEYFPGYAIGCIVSLAMGALFFWISHNIQKNK